ncbi:MAG: phage integrase N-terminal SAM-like domain-containing protein [Actinomycetota bacterium]
MQRQLETPKPAPQKVLIPGDIEAIGASFRRSLMAENKSARTIKTYSEALRLFTEHLRRNGMPTAVASITREHIETFITDQLGRHKPSTACVRHRSLQAFWKCCVEEGEVRESPMAKMMPPKVPEEPVPVI